MTSAVGVKNVFLLIVVGEVLVKVDQMKKIDSFCEKTDAASFDTVLDTALCWFVNKQDSYG